MSDRGLQELRRRVATGARDLDTTDQLLTAAARLGAAGGVGPELLEVASRGFRDKAVDCALGDHEWSRYIHLPWEWPPVPGAVCRWCVLRVSDPAGNQLLVQQRRRRAASCAAGKHLAVQVGGPGGPGDVEDQLCAPTYRCLWCKEEVRVVSSGPQEANT